MNVKLKRFCLYFLAALFMLTVYKVRRQQGRVYYDWLRTIAVGIPSLYFSLSGILYYFTPLHDLYRPFINLIFESKVSLFSGLLLGYALITSIKKSPVGRDI